MTKRTKKSVTPAKSGRDQAGRFQKGHSGNAKGCPTGSRHRVSLLAEKLMGDDAEAVVRSVIRRAKKGDMVAARLILERIAPCRKGRPIELKLPTIETANDLSAALSALLRATANGQIAPDEAATLANVLDAKRRSIEAIEIEKRLHALEERITEDDADQ